MKYAVLYLPALLWSVYALSGPANAQSTCAVGGRFDFEIGVYLPPGSPLVHLVVRNEAGLVLWEDDLRTTSTVSGTSGCHWAGHVGESSPDPGDPRRVSLPANELLRFDFSPIPQTYGSFEYQLCRGAGAPFGRFRCPQSTMAAGADSTGVLLVYDPSFQGSAAMRVVVPAIMEGASGSIDSHVTDLYWVLPYDLEQACGRNCGVPSEEGSCDAEEAERVTPFLRRSFPQGQPGLIVNSRALWVIRAGNDVNWDGADIPVATPLLAFRGEACIEVRGKLSVKDLSLVAEKVFAGSTVWRGIDVVAGGSLNLGSGSVVVNAGDTQQSLIPGAVRTYNGEIVLDGAQLVDNYATGLYVSGDDGVANVRGGSAIRLSRIPTPLDPSVAVSGVWANAGAEVTIMEGSQVRNSRGPGVRATGTGTIVILDEAIVEENGFLVSGTPSGVGVEASDGAEVFFAIPDESGNPLATSLVRQNIGGGLSSDGGASVVAGISDGVACRRYCNNEISGNAQFPAAGGFDARAQDGGVTFAEADFWGPGITQSSQLVLVVDSKSHLSVEPLLSAPPFADGGTPSSSQDLPGHAQPSVPDEFTTVGSLVASARALAALGDTTGAYADLAAALTAARTADERHAAYSSAVALLAWAQPPAVVSWLEARAATGGNARPWALRALAVARAASAQTVAATAAAQSLVDGYAGTSHARAGRAILVRLAVDAGDVAGAVAGLAALVQEFPGASETLAMTSLVSAAFPPAYPYGTLTEVGPASTRHVATVAPRVPLRIAVAPNPIRDRATLTLVLEMDAAVSAGLFDPLGRLMASLHEAPLSAGRHSFVLGGGDIAPGVYLVRVAASPIAEGRSRVAVVRVVVTR